MIKTIYENPLKTVLFTMLVGGYIVSIVDSITGFDRALVELKCTPIKKKIGGKKKKRKTNRD